MGNRKQFENEKVGLTLGSGGARGLSHIGIIKAIQKKNIPVDIVTGTSIGALVGACFAKNGNIDDFEQLMLNIDWKKLASLVDPNLILLDKGFVHGNKVKELLVTLIGDIDFSDLKIPMAIVATDVDTGEQVVLKEGSVIDAVRASISLPAVFVAARIKNRFLMDGGVVNPVPVDIAKQMGASFVIACDVSGAGQTRTLIEKNENIKEGKNKDGSREKNNFTENVIAKQINEELKSFVKENSAWFDKIQEIYKWAEELKPDFLKTPDLKAPSMIYTLTQAFYSMEYKIVQMHLNDADVIIRPDTGSVETLDFHRAKELILSGYNAAQKKL